MKCPKCNLEIDENIMNCPSCSAELFDHMEEEAEGALELVETEFLMTANDELQANIVESLLKAYGIPLRRKYKGNDTYGKIVLGLTVHGIDLYVPKTALEEAKGIIENEMPEEVVLEDTEEVVETEETEETEESTQQLFEKYDKRRRTRAWIVLIFFIPGLLWMFITAVRWIIHLLFQ